MAKKKAAFIDGVSLNCMKRRLNIDLIDFGGCYNVLLNNIGLLRRFGVGPFITLNTEVAGSLGKTVTGHGFIPIVANSAGGKDDQRLIDLISRINPDEIGEIVMVSSDRDYVPYLRQKVQDGVKVYWMASDTDNRSGCPQISNALKAHFASGEFTFVPLENYKARITLPAHRHGHYNNRGGSHHSDYRSPG